MTGPGAPDDDAPPDGEVVFARTGEALRADAGRALAMISAGIAAVALLEVVATVLAFPQDVSMTVAAGFALLTVALLSLVWALAAPLFVGAVVAPRLWAALIGDEAARRGAGFLAWRRGGGIPPAIARVWAVAVVAGVSGVLLQRVGFHVITHYKEQQLMALVIAVAALAWAPIALGLVHALSRLVRRIGRALHPRFGPVTPWTSWAGTLSTLLALVAVATAIALHRLPQLRPLVPWRLIFDVAALAAGMAVAAWWQARPRRPIATARRRQLAVAAALLGAATVPLGLLVVGANHEVRSMAITSSPSLASVVDVVRHLNDFDGDGFGSFFGEGDCGPFAPRIHRGARDLPDNGIDENCDGRDFSLRDLKAPAPGERAMVPSAFQRDWNILLLTVDTVRYDHTSFGGYKTGPKKRDTTPELAKLVAQSTSFSFANAPSAGTMASVPAILTSKFFHSGIALDEKVPHPMPPRLRPENTLIGEIMKRGGYTTGAILSHEYFNDWGMNQGIDEYDNEIGKTSDPFRVSSHLLTDRALAWVSGHARKKWFLWVHYLDPHGRYVAHPEDVSYGSSEEDLYDGELSYTDKHIGRLLEELKRLPGGERTIVIVTSDHGDGFNEHGFINHGLALYRELVHVPLIIYVPDNEPRIVPGAVTPLDIVPTIADLCRIDVSDLAFEGRSLVPQIFYGKADLDRVVFSETNWPRPLRAAVSSKHKLIYNLQNNLYELYDLATDPLEKANVVNKDRAAFATMKAELDAWLERVLFARDPLYNQAAMRMAEVLLAERPTPPNRLDRVTFDAGRLQLLGYEPEAQRYGPGDKVYVKLFFEVKERPSGSFRLQLVAWPLAPGASPTGPLPVKTTRSPMRLTLEGLFPSERWNQGEFIRERLGIIVPADWKDADRLGLGIWMTEGNGKAVPVTGATPANDPNMVVLGTVGFTARPAAPLPTPAPALQPSPPPR